MLVTLCAICNRVLVPKARDGAVCHRCYVAHRDRCVTLNAPSEYRVYVQCRPHDSQQPGTFLAEASNTIPVSPVFDNLGELCAWMTRNAFVWDEYLNASGPAGESGDYVPLRVSWLLPTSTLSN